MSDSKDALLREFRDNLQRALDDVLQIRVSYPPLTNAEREERQASICAMRAKIARIDAALDDDRIQRDGL